MLINVIFLLVVKVDKKLLEDMYGNIKINHINLFHIKLNGLNLEEKKQDSIVLKIKKYINTIKTIISEILSNCKNKSTDYST